MCSRLKTVQNHKFQNCGVTTYIGKKCVGNRDNHMEEKVCGRWEKTS